MTEKRKRVKPQPRHSQPSWQAEVRAAEQAQPRPSAGADRDEDDGRGDDRRGRRSRRRRRGGRDFPENKYARPSSAGAAPQRRMWRRLRRGQEPQTEVRRKIQSEPRGREDVIVLPGESLAKYRTRPAVHSSGPPLSRPLLSHAYRSRRRSLLRNPSLKKNRSCRTDAAEHVAVESAEAEVNWPKRPPKSNSADQVFSHQAPPAADKTTPWAGPLLILGVDRAASSEQDEERLRVEQFLNDPSPAHLP